MRLRRVAPPPPISGEPLRPLVKYVGGKRKLSAAIVERLPSFTGAYHEPFVGGGAVFCALRNAGRLDGRRVVLGDLNAGLMALYTALRDEPRQLVDGLRYLETRYQHTDPSALFYEQRRLWNEGLHDPFRYVFLKQTSFNGLWRLNRSGGLNAPWGKYPRPVILDEACIWSWHHALRVVELRTGDYLATCSPAAGDLVYLDPPYVGTFDAYTAGGFDDGAHGVLLEAVNRWVSAGVSIGYSNSLAAGAFVERDWPKGTRHVLSTSYSVSCAGSERGPVGELLVTS